MESFKRFGRLLGLSAVAAISPEVMAAPAAEQTVEVAANKESWATEVVDQCESDLKAAGTQQEAQEVVLRARQWLVKEFYFPGGDTQVAQQPHVRNDAESSVLLRAIDKMAALLFTVDTKYGTHLAEDSKEQLDDMRLKTKRSGNAVFQDQVETLNRAQR